MSIKNDFLGPNESLAKIKSLKNAIDRPLVVTNPINFLVNIKENLNVERGFFRPDKLIPGQYFAHPVTIRAMRKDIFVVSEDILDLEYNVECSSCKKILDAQFWFFCPYCEKSFDLIKDKFKNTNSIL